MIHRIPREEKEDRIIKEIITKKYVNNDSDDYTYETSKPNRILPHQGLISLVKITLAI